MKMNLPQLLLALFILAVFTFTGCKKETSAVNAQEDETFAIVSSESEEESETVFDDVFNNVMGVNAEVAYGETGVFGRINQYRDHTPSRVADTDSSVNPCFTVHINSVNPNELFPAKVVIDFGTGCTGRDGRTRKGKLIIVYTGRLTVSGKVAEIVFDGFYINDIQVEGAMRIQNISTSQSLIFTKTVKDGKLTKPNGNFSQWNSATIISQIEGSGTPYYAKDDIFSIRSESSGAVKNAGLFFTWQSKTIEPLIKKYSCFWIVKGKVVIQRINTDVAIIDYGNGICDNKATVTINGSIREITLR